MRNSDASVPGADKSHVGDQVQNPVAGSKQIEKAQET